jgi:hypothetical protein
MILCLFPLNLCKAFATYLFLAIFTLNKRISDFPYILNMLAKRIGLCLASPENLVKSPHITSKLVIIVIASQTQIFIVHCTSWLMRLLWTFAEQKLFFELPYKILCLNITYFYGLYDLQGWDNFLKVNEVTFTLRNLNTAMR